MWHVVLVVVSLAVVVGTVVCVAAIILSTMSASRRFRDR